MGDLMLLDTFPEFIKLWDGSPDSWLEYIKEHPELFEKIKWDYERYKMDWREYLKLITKRETEELRLAHKKLLDTLPGVEEKIGALFSIEPEEYNIAIYVGLENGAGWLTSSPLEGSGGGKV